jgi:iron complex outermembrane receptor protein
MTRKLRLLCSALVCAAPGVAWAQAATTASGVASAARPTAGQHSTEVQELVVTALKGNTSVHDTPATVQVITPQVLAQKNVVTAVDLAKVVPGLQEYVSPQGNPSVILYGLGTPAAGTTFDQSVLALVDGAPNSHSRAFMTSIFDVQDIEVIKGVQAAVLGKNSSLGAVEITTRKPGNTLEYNASVSHEFALGSSQFDGGVSVPVNDQLSIRIAGRILDDQGWVRNDVLNTMGPTTTAKSVRLTAFWRPMDSFDYTASAEGYSSDTEGVPFEAYLDPGGVGAARCAAAGVPCEFRLDRHTQQTDTQNWGGANNYDKLWSSRFVGTGHYYVSGLTVTSVTSYQAHGSQTLLDVDRLPGGYFTPLGTERNNTFTQELRLSSPTTGRLQYLAGGFYSHDEFDLSSLVKTATVNGNTFLTGSNFQSHKQTTSDYSIFGQASFEIIDGLKAIGGVRYTKEDKTARPSNTLITPGIYSSVLQPPFPEQHFSLSGSNTDYSVALQYALNPNVMVYASYGKGTKSGGFAGGGKYVGAYDPATSPAQIYSSTVYKPEVAHIAEVGGKFTLGPLGYVNISAYDIQVKDAQVSTTIGPSIVYLSRDQVSQGANLEAALMPMEGVTLAAQVNYNWGRDKTVDRPLTYNPLWSGMLSAEYKTAVRDDWTLRTGLMLDFRSNEFNRQPGLPGDIGMRFGSVQRLGAQVALANRDGWEIALIGQNLNDKLVVTSASAATGFGGIALSTDRPRTVMLKLSYSH